jgi:CheY-like chemotaxis protein
VEYLGEEPVLMRGAARNITVRKQMELELLEADRRKNEFLAILAHELRNPLAPIRNSLDVLRLARDDQATLAATVEILERQVNHMVRLVDDLLEVSRISRGIIELDREEIDVHSLVRTAIEMSRPLIENAGHELVVDAADEPLIVDGDSVRLTQSVANLLNNAAKYTQARGQIRVTIGREDRDAVISVCDTGIGIPAEMLSQIFELFTQIRDDSGRFQCGLGIGLTLVKSLVELHGGSIQARSAGVGLGSEFAIRLPLIERAPAPQPQSRATAEPMRLIRNARILIVDDNRDAAQTMGKLLQSLGAEVLVTFNGPEAINRLPNFQPDSVLLDIGMPGMDGYETARRIREWPEHRGIRLIALTGWGQEGDRRRTSQAGFDAHLVKPVDMGQLLAALT